jgi:hypothetical protein
VEKPGSESTPYLVLTEPISPNLASLPECWICVPSKENIKPTCFNHWKTMPNEKSNLPQLPKASPDALQWLFTTKWMVSFLTAIDAELNFYSFSYF